MKWALVVILSLVFIGMFLGGMFSITQNLTNKASEVTKISERANKIQLNISQQNYTMQENGGLNLTRGVYNVTAIDEDLKKKLLDPTQWYVTNTSLSYEYAQKMYNETLKIVENSTKQSKSIIEKFLGIFRENESREIKNTLDKLIERVENMTKMLKK
ncbi:hypothetical protein [Pyrococcus kukulkanii]|uniref:Uncharacterized protein n=1 Tax=Pyrococcus kukulkanii TaxID=1609559 RepID=A0A127BD00_9EURY|nr:hypothetical protein [Pyrococcus kukulkanii]AMM54556.1 hypothetical protein TQ32_08745 [Pyrococcus kukulkanii]